MKTELNVKLIKYTPEPEKLVSAAAKLCYSKKGLEKQQNNVSELLKLIQENPDLEILPMVDSEIGGDDYSYYMAEWGNAEIDEYHHVDERIYFKSEDFEELVEDFIDNNYEFYKNIDDYKLEELAEREVNNLEWIKAIVVHIDSI